MHFFTTVATAASFLPLVAGHGIIQEIIGGGQPWGGSYPWTTIHRPGWYAQNNDWGFVLNVGSPNITCHHGARPGTQHIPITAGDTVSVKWSDSWPHSGPVMNYMARCPGSCADVNPASLRFFKIDHAGLVRASTPANKTPYWAANQLRDSGNVWNIKIPTNIQAGNYVLRHETIALHDAKDLGKAQFYPQCINLRVAGRGTLAPQGVPAQQLYKPTEPGVLTNIWWPSPTAYQIPGPTVAAGLQFRK